MEISAVNSKSYILLGILGYKKAFYLSYLIGLQNFNLTFIAKDYKMENLQLPKAKLLYLVSELWKSRDISDAEKIMAKRKLIHSIFDQNL